MKKRILLTGGSGFIGSNIRESYLSEKYDIIAPSHKEMDIANTESVDNFFAYQYFDVVLHTAVKPGHRAATDTSKLFYTNVRMFENLERNRDSFGKFINFGSGAVYDTSQNNENVSEQDIYKHIGVAEHDFTKYVVHKQIDNLPNFYDLNIFGIFGKHEDYSIRFISNAICKSLYGLPITLRQNRKFSYLYIDDLMPILEWFIENKPNFKSYNIVPNGYVELRDIAYTVANINRKSEVKIANDGLGLSYYGSNARLRSEIPNLRFTPIDTAILKLYDWYQQNIFIINKQNLIKDK